MSLTHINLWLLPFTFIYFIRDNPSSDHITMHWDEELGSQISEKLNETES